MAHVLAKLTGAKFENVKRKLEEDASEHAKEGMYLEHLWRNADNPNEVLFLFRVNDLNHCKQRINKTHAEVRQKDPNATLPQMTFLDGARGSSPEPGRFATDRG